MRDLYKNYTSRLLNRARRVRHKLLSATPGKGSLAYRENKDAILGGEVPGKYARVARLVPGRRVLEVGAAEGVLALLLAREKEQVYALDRNIDRHEEARRLQTAWRKNGVDVDRCKMIFGDLRERLDLLARVDTLVAVRSIYYLRDDLHRVFETIGRHVENVVLCGNAERAANYLETGGNTGSSLGAYEYYATLVGMTDLLKHAGYRIVETLEDDDPIVVGIRGTSGNGELTPAG
jgi:protein-L-isoaspartate O-methyltransferase